ncbi:hypothetical protein, partial [Propioniciclava sp. MC1595]
MSVAATGVALTGNTSGPESQYRLALNRNNQWPSRLQILIHTTCPSGNADRIDNLLTVRQTLSNYGNRAGK